MLALMAASATLTTTLSMAQPGRRDGVSVSGTRLFLDGRPWIPHGLYQIAFEQPPTFSDEHGFWKIASRFYSPEEYGHMRDFGADTVRIQLAQTGMDPQNRLSTPEYRNRALEAVRSAREAGLVVIVSMQDESQTGEQRPADLPDDATQRAWRVVAPAFARDRGVMLELFNEPRPLPSPPTWGAWAAAMNRTLHTVRDLGAINVVIADGLGVGQTLRGAPLLDDPFGQVAYASHPYVTKQSGPAAQTPEAWDMKFGNFSHRAPVLISEWGIGYYCDAQTPSSVATFLQYLQQHGIGLVAGTWDWAPADFRSVRFGFPHPQTSSFVGGTCDSPGFGPGRMVKAWFRTGTAPSSVQ